MALSLTLRHNYFTTFMYVKCSKCYCKAKDYICLNIGNAYSFVYVLIFLKTVDMFRIMSNKIMQKKKFQKILSATLCIYY